MSAGVHHHHTLAPSGQGTVVLNIGAGIGALVIYTPGSLHGHEIEVSPVTDPAVRTHAAVRARYVRGGRVQDPGAPDDNAIRVLDQQVAQLEARRRLASPPLVSVRSHGRGPPARIRARSRACE